MDLHELTIWQLKERIEKKELSSFQVVSSLLSRIQEKDGFGDEAKRRIILGAYVLSSGYYDAYYVKAQKVRTLIRNDFIEAFKRVDVLITPTTPELPFEQGAKKDDPLKMLICPGFLR